MTDAAGPGLETRPPAKFREFRVMEIARHSAIVGLAGVITGLVVGGIGGRILMRVAAVAAPDRIIGATTENGNRIGDITIGGTLEIILFVGILLGLVGAIAYLIAEPWLSWAGRWHGVVFGGFLLAIGGSGTLSSSNFDFFLVGNQELVVAMFIALFLGFGAFILPVTSWLEKRLPPIDPERPVAGGYVYLVLAAFGLQFLLLFFVQFFDDDAASGEAPVLTGILMIGLAAVTGGLLTGRLRYRGHPESAMRILRGGGYGFLMAAVVVGGAMVIDEVSSILSL